MRRAFGDRARLVSVDVVGHAIAYGINANVSACADAATTEFLVGGEPPPGDPTCGPEPAARLGARERGAVQDLRRVPLLFLGGVAPRVR
jgi:hypothetical protein